MKLLVCFLCHDVVALRHETRSCTCGRTSGQYVDEVRAVIRGTLGNFAGLGFGNSSLSSALRAQLDQGDLPPAHSFGGQAPGRSFDAFVLPANCPSVTYECL